MKCECGKLADYGKECRDCYEQRIRHEATDAYDRDSKVRARMMLHKERCRRRMYKNYEGAVLPSQFRGRE